MIEAFGTGDSSDRARERTAGPALRPRLRLALRLRRDEPETKTALDTEVEDEESNVEEPTAHPSWVMRSWAR